MGAYFGFDLEQLLVRRPFSVGNLAACGLAIVIVAVLIVLAVHVDRKQSPRGNGASSPSINVMPASNSACLPSNKGESASSGPIAWYARIEDMASHDPKVSVVIANAGDQVVTVSHVQISASFEWKDSYTCTSVATQPGADETYGELTQVPGLEVIHVWPIWTSPGGEKHILQNEFVVCTTPALGSCGNFAAGTLDWVFVSLWYDLQIGSGSRMSVVQSKTIRFSH